MLELLFGSLPVMGITSVFIVVLLVLSADVSFSVLHADTTKVIINVAIVDVKRLFGKRVIIIGAH